jgi:LuxR family maltose regulon positive regulatory protein
LFEFLATEVIDRLEPALRRFLLRTSLLPELNAARGAALSGDAQAAMRLEQIERAGLFATRLEAGETTLRLHDLFRAALQARLQREEPELFPTLYRHAALTESDPMRRLTWLLRAEDWDSAEAACQRDGPPLTAQGQGAAVQALLGQFPPHRLEGSPALQLLRAQLAWSRWDWGTAIEATARASEPNAKHARTTASRSPGRGSGGRRPASKRCWPIRRFAATHSRARCAPPAGWRCAATSARWRR